MKKERKGERKLEAGRISNIVTLVHIHVFVTNGIVNYFLVFLGKQFYKPKL